MHFHNQRLLVVLFVVVAMVTVLAVPAMAQSRSRSHLDISISTGRHGGVSFSFKHIGRSGSSGWNIETHRRGPTEFGAYSRTDRGYYGYRSGEWGGRIHTETYGRHSSDFTLSMPRYDDNHYRDSRFCNGFRYRNYQPSRDRIVFVAPPAPKRPRYVGENPDGSINLPPAPHMDVVNVRP